jgi:hypothetical protein
MTINTDGPVKTRAPRARNPRVVAAEAITGARRWLAIAGAYLSLPYARGRTRTEDEMPENSPEAIARAIYHLDAAANEVAAARDLLVKRLDELGYTYYAN